MNFKRLLKPLLIIFAILILTLSVSAGDLFGTYDKRIKLTIDHTKIDADLSWFPVTVFLGNYGDAIDVGETITAPAYTTPHGSTIVNKGNPANASGKITSVQIYTPYLGLSGAIVATFYRPDPSSYPNKLTARDSYAIGTVASGSVQIIDVDLNVEAGDYLGIYYSAGSIERITSGDGIWRLPDNHTETTGESFDLYSDLAIALYATGFEKVQGAEVFDELDADEDFDRIAFTSSDGVTQLYADCELFDDSERKAIYHVSKTGWTVSSSTDTDIFLYFDNDAGHNTTYISKSGGTAAQSVWDSNFKAVYHMQDNTTSTILDSTSNDNDGTKRGANQPIEATGKVGQGQDFDGTDDYINVGNSGLDPGENDFTIETVFSRHAYDAHHRLFNKRDAVPLQWYDIALHSDNTIESSIAVQYGTIGAKYLKTATTFTDATWHYHAAIFDRDGNLQNYIDGVADGSALDISDNAGNLSPDYSAYIGSFKELANEMNGIIDEQRISFSLRSDAWIAATYDSLWDTLLTYGSEETAPPASDTNVLFIFSNF